VPEHRAAVHLDERRRRTIVAHSAMASTALTNGMWLNVTTDAPGANRSTSALSQSS
jgi:hypothetical protein